EAADAEVLEDGEVRREAELLVDEREAELPGSVRVVRERHLRAAHFEPRPGVGSVVPGETLDQRRLARAVLADERVDLSGRHVDVYLAKDGDAVEGLRQVPHRQKLPTHRFYGVPLRGHYFLTSQIRS